MSIKIRVASGCFHREHSPHAYSVIDRYLSRLPPGEPGFTIVEHESGPEILAYIALATTGANLLKSVIDLIIAIIKSRSDGVKEGDSPNAPVELMVRRVGRDDNFLEESILRIGHHEAIDSSEIEARLRRALDSVSEARQDSVKRSEKSEGEDLKTAPQAEVARVGRQVQDFHGKPMRKAATHDLPTSAVITRAREAYRLNEPRDLFYRAATELVELALNQQSSLSLAEAVAVLLQTWNKAYYRFHEFNEDHVKAIDTALEESSSAIQSYRRRSIETLCSGDEELFPALFARFEDVLGPVGAAKCLHLLAPQFFPLWDNPIAKHYGIPLKGDGRNRYRYLLFALEVKEQCSALQKEGPVLKDPLKALDEYNYCKYTLKLDIKTDL